MTERVELQESREQCVTLLQEKTTCDKYDYLVAAGCGVIGGLVDIFFVGAPGASPLGNWTDAQVDEVVKFFAKQNGWPCEGKENNVKSAIGYLEKGVNKRTKEVHAVNYDHRYASDVGNAFSMGAKNHHMKSLAHSPDIVGWFFSVLNQFTSTATFVSDGQIITIATDTFELHGGNFIAKVFCGTANWLWHIMSDVAGSSGAADRGSGIVMPFYELFGLCNFGRFNVGKDKQTLAKIAVRAFQEGYDFRFSVAQAIPVVLTNCLIRLIWALRSYFQYKRPLKECIPTARHEDLRVMLLVGNGTLCVIDGADAAIRSSGNFLAFFMRLNLVAWFRFVKLVLKEICLRIGITDPLSAHIEAFRQMNAALDEYIRKLEALDMQRFQEETARNGKISDAICAAGSQQELNTVLLAIYQASDYETPWEKGTFDEFMHDRTQTLIFK